ncbi:hypothetical protein OAM69_01360 [bacterium]|nr:hypothetical protein [bacterium]
MNSQSELYVQDLRPPKNSLHSRVRINLVRKTLLVVQLSLYLAASIFGSGPSQADEYTKTCVYISSYHRGLEWSDRIEASLRAQLAGHCRFVQFDMDTKRHSEHDNILDAAASALKLIRKESPDVVITSDDNAARYLIVPHLLDTELPVVFLGINWTVEEYGFPAKNVTGIVEIAPLAPLISAAIELVPGAKRVVYIGDQTHTNSKNFKRYSMEAEDAGLEIDHLQATTFSEWLDLFDHSQRYDFIIMGGIAGITDWDSSAAIRHVEKNTRVLAVTTQEWSMPYASLGFTQIPEEHAEWAGRTAAAILCCTSPASIPIVTNRKWDTWVNNSLIQDSNAQVSDAILPSAKQIHH